MDNKLHMNYLKKSIFEDVYLKCRVGGFGRAEGRESDSYFHLYDGLQGLGFARILMQLISSVQFLTEETQHNILWHLYSIIYCELY